MPFSVLLIDDDESFRRLLELRLRSFLKEMTATSFGALAPAREFLQRSPRPEIDLVVIDQHLPDGRGVDFIREGLLEGCAVLSMSSDDAPEIPGAAVEAGAHFFLGKRHASDPLFRPLVMGIIERARLQRELVASRVAAAKMDTVKTLVGTLRHEINNPLGAVLGGAYLMANSTKADPGQQEAARLVESSGKRIKHVLDQLCSAVELETVTKGQQDVFQVPGDAPWDTATGKK